ncbi:MAG: ATP-dependent zinc metalloprotease FtsH [Pseudomonadales bacterium]|jgi:cell division protease FtsH|nr:ATP-dependent zinc metalloprotease FtsH [Pseudomonadales bacterium]
MEKQASANKVDKKNKADKQTDDLRKSFADNSGNKKKSKRWDFGFNKLFGSSFFFILVLILFLPFIISLLGQQTESISLSEFVRDLQEDRIAKLEVAGDEIRITYHEPADEPLRRTTRKEPGQQVLEILDSAGIDLATTNLTVENISGWQLFWEFVISLVPFLIIGVVFFFLFRSIRGGAGDIMGIGKSKAKLYIKGKQRYTFSDVGGMDEAKKELEEIVDFLKHPARYRKVGARTPKGVLLVGPAGTGKTLLARAVAGEANVQFLSIAGSEFMEMLVGVGASRVRDLFDTAKKMAPAIIFIDEIDAIGRARTGGGSGGHDEREQTLNQILVEMDGFSQNDNVIVIAATNRGDMLDPALVRPGRFDRRVMVNLPDLKEREYILNIHAKGKPIDPDLKLLDVARMTAGFSGADLENMLNEAAIASVRENNPKINRKDLGEAAIKVQLGPSKKRLTDEYERRMTAYHESGHAIVSHLLPHADPVSRISIISRGNALGYTITPPNNDRMQITKSQMMAEMSVLLGGRVAEELVFNEQTAGASSDISRATKIARNMVEEWGMSSLGPVFLGAQYETDNYSKMWMDPKTVSPKVAELVDQEVKKFVDDAYQTTKDLLNKHLDQLHRVSEELLDKESLEGDEFTKLMGCEKADDKQVK